MADNIILFLEEYQSIITAIVVTGLIIYILVERWLERRKNKIEGKKEFINKKR